MTPRRQDTPPDDFHVRSAVVGFFCGVFCCGALLALFVVKLATGE